ncbi:MAG: hypothetical protein WC456_03370 [Patescibacteria group bacterium]
MIKLLERVNFKHIFWFFFYFFIFCLLLQNSFSYLDPDFGWHLQVGREIIETRAIPDLNHYNYTFTGHWVDHEWLSNLAVYLIYSHWGYIAVSSFFAALIVFVLILMNRAASRIRPGSFFLIIFLQLFGTVAALPHLGVRMQESGWLFLFLLLSIISGYNRRPDWRRLAFLPPLMYLWSCFHGSFLIGFTLAAAWLAIKGVENILTRFWPQPWLDLSARLDFRKVLNFAIAVGLSFVATLFTPYRADLYSFLGGYRSTFYLSHIQEWLSQFYFPFQYWQLLYLALVVLGIFLYLYYSWGRVKIFRVDLWTIFLTILFVGLSFQSRRHFPLLFVATFLFLVETYGRVFQAAAVRAAKPGLGRWLKGFLLACLLIVSASELIKINFNSEPFYGYCREYPCGAADYLRDHPELDNLKIFNEYVWGGYLIWQLPVRQLFIDGRLPQVEFAGHTFLEEYLDFLRPDSLFAAKLDEYRIELALLSATDQPIPARNWEKFMFNIKEAELTPRNYLRDYLASAPDWQVIYRDETAVLYKKNN